MALINGGVVMGMSSRQEYDFISRKNRHLLLQGRFKHFYHLFDRLVMVNPDLRDILSYIERKVSKKWAKTLRGRVLGVILIRYTDFCLHPAVYAYKGDLIFFANYFWIQQYLGRIVKVLILRHGYPDKFYGFKIKKDKLLSLSELWAKDMLPMVERVLVPHYNIITDFGKLPQYKDYDGTKGTADYVPRYGGYGKPKQTREEYNAKRRARYAYYKTLPKEQRKQV